MVSPLASNARDLEIELRWLSGVLDARLAAHFGSASPPAATPPDLRGSESPYARFVVEHDLPPALRLIILLALTPHIRPRLLDVLWARNEATQRGFTEFGGMQGTSHGGFIPTGETAVFLLAGDDLAMRFQITHLFEGGQFFARHNAVHLASVPTGESQLAGTLTLSRDLLQRFTTGLDQRPSFSTDFPARLIETELDWDELILPQSTRDQLEEIRHWVRYGDTLLREWGMGRALGPGFTSLFHGAPGTGKTVSASLLGKYCGTDVYKIDLSMIVSKYIGETEKNLAKVFDLAEHKRWILFFDEADALFGKRTRVDDAHDRFANQEISFLLQRIEDFHGVVILASNFKDNIDDAFVRRFQSVVHFPIPKAPERLRIWRNAFPSQARLEDDVDLPRLAERYDVTGGTIMNVVRHASLMALSRGGRTIRLDDVDEGIRRELLKEGRAS